MYYKCPLGSTSSIPSASFSFPVRLVLGGMFPVGWAAEECIYSGITVLWIPPCNICFEFQVQTQQEAIPKSLSITWTWLSALSCWSTQTSYSPEKCEKMSDILALVLHISLTYTRHTHLSDKETDALAHTGSSGMSHFWVKCSGHDECEIYPSMHLSDTSPLELGNSSPRFSPRYLQHTAQECACGDWPGAGTPSSAGVSRS